MIKTGTCYSLPKGSTSPCAEPSSRYLILNKTQQFRSMPQLSTRSYASTYYSSVKLCTPYSMVFINQSINQLCSNLDFLINDTQVKCAFSDKWCIVELIALFDFYHGYTFIFEPCHEKKNCFCNMRTTKALISLCIRAIWSAPCCSLPG